MIKALKRRRVPYSQEICAGGGTRVRGRSERPVAKRDAGHARGEGLTCDRGGTRVRGRSERPVVKRDAGPQGVDTVKG